MREEHQASWRPCRLQLDRTPRLDEEGFVRRREKEDWYPGLYRAEKSMIQHPIPSLSSEGFSTTRPVISLYKHLRRMSTLLYPSRDHESALGGSIRFLSCCCSPTHTIATVSPWPDEKTTVLSGHAIFCTNNSRQSHFPAFLNEHIEGYDVTCNRLKQ